MDTISKAKRSWNMSLIISKNTQPEIIFRKLIFKAGYRYRLHNKKLLGVPDLTLKQYNTVVFINGCFWHGHKNCKRGNIPKSNKSYWSRKIESNIYRDKTNIKKLKKEGWNIFTIWECELKNTEKAFKKFEQFIKKIEADL